MCRFLPGIDPGGTRPGDSGIVHTLRPGFSLLSDYVSPWLVSFVVRWAWEVRMNLEAGRPDAILVVRYKGLIADPEGTFAWLLHSLRGQQLGTVNLGRMDADRSLLNVGVPGRGQEIDEQFPFIRERFAALAAPYPDVNVDLLLRWEPSQLRAQDLLAC